MWFTWTIGTFQVGAGLNEYATQWMKLWVYWTVQQQPHLYRSSNYSAYLKGTETVKPNLMFMLYTQMHNVICKEGSTHAGTTRRQPGCKVPAYICFSIIISDCIINLCNYLAQISAQIPVLIKRP